MRVSAVVIAAALFMLCGCTATIPNGVIACDHVDDCPTGFACHAEGASEKMYCFHRGSGSAAAADDGNDGKDAGQDASAGGTGGKKGASSSGGSSDAGGTGGKAGANAKGGSGGSSDLSGNGGSSGADSSSGTGGAGEDCEPCVFDESLFDDTCFQ